MYQDSSKNQSFLEKVDIFGISIAIRFSHLPRHNTRFGGLITISILAIILFQLIQTLINIFTYNSPQVIQSDDYVFEPEPFEITPKTFNLAMGLQDENFNQFYDEKIYQVKATQQTLQKVFNSTSNQYDPIWTYETLNISTCSQNNFQIQEIKSYFLGISYPVMYCFDVNEDRAKIQGEFSANIYKAIEIDFIECVDKDYCASAEEKAKYLTNPTLGLFFSNKIVQIQNKDNPYNSVGKNLYWLSGPSFQKYITLNLMNAYINSDFSLFGTSKSTQRIVQFSSYQEQVVPRTNPVMFRLLLVYEKNREVNYYRKYIKIDQAFSQIGGMFNLLLTIGFLICKPISQLELNRKLLNSIFNISDGKNKEDQTNINQRKSMDQKKISFIEEPVLKIHEIDKQKENLTQNIKNNLENQQTLEIQEQIKEFNPKNRIQQTKREEVKFCYFDNEEKTQLERAYDAQKAFNIIINEQKKSKLDEKLIRMLDTKLINLFADNSFDANSAKETEDPNKHSENKDFENLNISILTRAKKKSIFNNKQATKKSYREEVLKLDYSSEMQEQQFQKLNKFQSVLYNCDEQEEEQQQCQIEYDKNEAKTDDLQVKKTIKPKIPYHQEISFKILQKQLDDD
ncbi:transmembrane protein, putative (macronuclear) [Tetrahymena thermophila SB210]|uniref:Transmembrane protein, putative n=1 Tax=Tetrahymena thermophila (strain SB210) TaxID=312017 RepID=Q22H09_TETTS|nr:transmembrane protein, putative [Tetrahymena thermophila SB210]EAR84515.2 transmembrane protein, putative [Tetrahymena thermophila SB210]|eukprot:XP_001032178.2 transmembrane protein, putative [Tetrahymena thermophila SB210]